MKLPACCVIGPFATDTWSAPVSVSPVPGVGSPPQMGPGAGFGAPTVRLAARVT